MRFAGGGEGFAPAKLADAEEEDDDDDEDAEKEGGRNGASGGGRLDVEDDRPPLEGAP